MTNFRAAFFATLFVLVGVVAARAEVKTTVDHNDNAAAKSEFKFKRVPAPAKESAASKAKLTIVDGRRDENGAETKCLIDGKLPTEEDEPAANFFFDAGTPGGRLQMDLGKTIEIKQVNTYSWHPNTRGPQVYRLYASDGAGKDFKAEPKSGADPAKVGWKLIATVDTRPKKSDDMGGQYGVSHADAGGGAIGKYRYLLFDMSRTEDDDPFGNTFYSEITVIEKK
jgi:hypothetical protein